MTRLPAFTIPLLTALLCAVCLGSGRAQSLPGLVLPSTAPGNQLGPGGVRVEGLYRTAPISVDGVPLFRIATLATVASDQITVEEREQSIDAAIAQLLAPANAEPDAGTSYDPKTLHVMVQEAGDQALLVATDAHHSTPLALLTVTVADARYARLTIPALAAQWQPTLQAALVAALQKRQPAEVRRNVADLWYVTLGLAAATLAVALLHLFLGKRIAGLRASIVRNAREKVKAGSVDPERPSASVQRLRFMGLVIRSSGPEMSLQALRALSTILSAGLALAWFFALVWALALFPQTTEYSHFLEQRVETLAVIVVASIVLARLAGIAISRAARIYGETADLGDGEERARLLLRIPTIARAVGAFFTIVVALAALLAAMKAVGISTDSVLTFGGILALGLTFAAQNLLRDFLNGAFVLIEDQYVVGDYVVIDEWSGVVEHMTLRVVQIRDGGGNLITIPHGQVTQVVNCSRNWSRVDYRVPIDPRADVPAAIGLLRATLESLAAEKRFDGWMLDPVELIGVDAVSASGIVLRASIKTAPLRQFELKREINARIVARFREAGIAFGIDPKTPATLTLNQGPL